ncbi:hypothetical protein BJX99DRAFT_8092 [Aspergillus californicus]
MRLIDDHRQRALLWTFFPAPPPGQPHTRRLVRSSERTSSSSRHTASLTKHCPVRTQASRESRPGILAHGPWHVLYLVDHRSHVGGDSRLIMQFGIWKNWGPERNGRVCDIRGTAVTAGLKRNSLPSGVDVGWGGEREWRSPETRTGTRCGELRKKPTQVIVGSGPLLRKGTLGRQCTGPIGSKKRGKRNLFHNNNWFIIVKRHRAGILPVL